MENTDFNQHPPTFGSNVNSPLMPKDSNNRYQHKQMVNSRSWFLKDSMIKDSFVNNSSFLVKENEIGSLAMLAELLNSQPDWEKIPDIVRYSIKAIYDSCQKIIAIQGQVNKEIERNIEDKASKQELSSCVHVKANITDVSVIISEIASQIELKIDEETLHNAINDKACYDDLQQLDDKKLDVHHFEEFIDSLDLESITTSLQSKANWTDLNEILASKVDKETFTNSLNKKVSKNELTELESVFDDKMIKMESALKSKIEKILEAQDQFIHLVESGELVNKSKITHNNPVFEDIRRTLEGKLDRREIDIYNQEQLNSLNSIKDEVQHVIKELSSNIDCYKNSWDKSISKLNESMSKEIKVITSSMQENMVIKGDHKKELSDITKEIDTKFKQSLELNTKDKTSEN